MTLKNRLALLEKQNPQRDALRLELMKPSEVQVRADALRAGIIEKWDAVLMGEVLPTQPSDPATDALRAEILRRLERIANDTKEQTATA